jgi:RNA polymerase sigma factor (TIGR02999 family)
MSQSMKVEADVTELLWAVNGGDREALARVVPRVYDQLRRLARQRLARERAGHTLGTTGLVHEAYLKLAGAARVAWRDRDHFFAVTSRMMRRILVDYARKRRAGKRGHGQAAVAIEDVELLPGATADALVELDDALGRLRAVNSRRAQVLELHYFGGLTVEQTAAALDVSLGTAERDLRFARAWLAERLRGGRPAIAAAPRR